MQIETWPIDRPQPYEKNPRLNDDAVAAVANSIREFGFRQPIVVDEEGVVIIGHTRLKAAKQLGLTEVPVHVARGLAPEKVKALRLADNKTAEIAEWNLELLPIELSELQGMNFDLGLLGFDQDELAKLLDPGVQEGMADPDEIPAPPDDKSSSICLPARGTHRPGAHSTRPNKKQSRLFILRPALVSIESNGRHRMTRRTSLPRGSHGHEKKHQASGLSNRQIHRQSVAQACDRARHQEGGAQCARDGEGKGQGRQEEPAQALVA